MSRTTPVPRASVAAILLASGPRFARDSILPPLAFYVAWRALGLTAAMLSATAAAAAIWWWERSRSRTGVGASIGLTLAAGQALAGLTTGSAVAFFAPGVLVNAFHGMAFFVSVLLGRPLAGTFANDTYPFPPDVKASATYRRVFSRVSLAWGSYLLLRSLVRILALVHGDVSVIVTVNILTGVPFTAGLTTWSIWYGVRGFRRSHNLGVLP
jgi:uncharacterized protein DUF3159